MNKGMLIAESCNVYADDVDWNRQRLTCEHGSLSLQVNDTTLRQPRYLNDQAPFPLTHLDIAPSLMAGIRLNPNYDIHFTSL